MVMFEMYGIETNYGNNGTTGDAEVINIDSIDHEVKYNFHVMDSVVDIMSEGQKIIPIKLLTLIRQYEISIDVSRILIKKNIIPKYHLHHKCVYKH